MICYMLMPWGGGILLHLMLARLVFMHLVDWRLILGNYAHIKNSID